MKLTTIYGVVETNRQLHDATVLSPPSDALGLKKGYKYCSLPSKILNNCYLICYLCKACVLSRVQLYVTIKDTKQRNG